MRPTVTARCAGMADLFDSVRWVDHVRARALCSSCPLSRDCLDTAITESRGAGAVPNGTWGGVLWGSGHVLTLSDMTAEHGTEAAYWRHKRTGQKPCGACTNAHITTTEGVA